MFKQKSSNNILFNNEKKKYWASQVYSASKEKTKFEYD